MRGKIALQVPLVILAVCALRSQAYAEPTDQDKALATTLFNEGKALLAAGKVGDACRKLEESRRLDPLAGTLLNLAVCHEQEGLLASALAEFREARVLADRDHREDRLALVDEHLRTIEPRVATLVIVLGPGADIPELRITRDETALGRAAWGIRIPVDPGEHLIVVSAPAKKATRILVNVHGEGEVATVVVTPLEDETPPLVAPPLVLAEIPRSPVRAETRKGREPLSTRRSLAIVVAASGAVGLGLGTYFGVSAIQKHNDPAATCTTAPCSSSSLSLNNKAKVAADVSTVSVVTGLVGLGVGAFLWFGESTRRPERAGLTVLPAWAPGHCGVDVRGHF